MICQQCWLCLTWDFKWALSTEFTKLLTMFILGMVIPDLVPRIYMPSVPPPIGYFFLYQMSWIFVVNQVSCVTS